MKKPIEVWHIIIATLGILLSFGTIAFNTMTRITRLEDKDILYQKQFEELISNVKEINVSLKEMVEGQNQMKLDLKDKQDRKP